jgi:hypothetical protein
MSDKKGLLNMKDSHSSNEVLDKHNSRRGFFKKAAIGTALITTISSRPVWARGGGGGGCTISGNLSGNVSHPHDGEPCRIKGYSPGGWCNGHANNNNLWQYIGFTKESDLSTLFGSYALASFDAAPTAKIKDALGRQCNGNSSKLGLGNGDGSGGLWRQRTAAALNSLVWQHMLTACQNNPGCVFLGNSSPVDGEFYFPWTLAEIMSKTETALATANNAL